MDLLRFTTAGSVDDGKSTLIGRLLYETRSIFRDQLEAIAGASRQRGDDRIDLALLTDGLRAEREQMITIEVAYRSFETDRRRFIIADTPGHVQYTRNMVTGASTADLAILLVDATKGVLTQSRRHAFIASLLGIPHLTVAVNKMDLVGFSETVYDRIVAEFSEFAQKLTLKNITYLPLSALEGDNVVQRSSRLAWYRGGPLLHLLETLPAGGRTNAIDFRLPVQIVIRPHQQFRGVAGTIASGAVRVGDEIVALPSNVKTRIASIATPAGTREVAAAGEAVVLTTEDDIDIARGDMIARPRNVPEAVRSLDAYLCWMDAAPLQREKVYVLAHTTREVQATVTGVQYRVDVDTLHRHDAESLAMNDVGRVQIATAGAIFVDSYLLNSATGSFILVDPHTNATVAAGMIRGAAQAPTDRAPVDVVRPEWSVPRTRREERQGHRAAIVWFTGMPGAGKTTIAQLVEEQLFSEGHHTMLLDGDQVRHGLCADLGFSPVDRAENIRRAGEVARLFFEAGAIVLCAFVSPYRRDRDRVRQLVGEGRFIEVFVCADVETCRARDPKGLYKRAMAGQIDQFTGVSAPYEEPLHPELVVDTTSGAPAAAAERVMDYLRANSLTRAGK
jgi:bifunctional enzyme CysN/CysC